MAIKIEEMDQYTIRCPIWHILLLLWTDQPNYQIKFNRTLTAKALNSVQICLFRVARGVEHSMPDFFDLLNAWSGNGWCLLLFSRCLGLRRCQGQLKMSFLQKNIGEAEKLLLRCKWQKISNISMLYKMKTLLSQRRRLLWYWSIRQQLLHRVANHKRGSRAYKWQQRRLWEPYRFLRFFDTSGQIGIITNYGKIFDSIRKKFRKRSAHLYSGESTQ